MKKYFQQVLGLSIFFLCQIPQLQARPFDDEKIWSHSFCLGYNPGAVSPLPLPENVRKINSWSPGFSPCFGYGICYNLHKKWSLETGLILNFKNMRVEDSVIYMRTLITKERDGKTADFEGDFSGTNRTIVKTTYISVPLSLCFRPGLKWRFSGGVYFSWLLNGRFYGSVSNGYIRQGGPLGEKVLIDHADFDFSDKLRKFDWGAQLFISRTIFTKLSGSVGFQWGLRPVFDSEFTGIGFPMYNLYGSLGLKWEL